MSTQVEKIDVDEELKLGRFIIYYPQFEEIKLDGSYTLADLKAIIEWVEAHG